MGVLRRLFALASKQDDKSILPGLSFGDLGFGFDRYGMSRDSVETVFLLSQLLYRRYFRVESHGHQLLPNKGAAILAANHAGLLPIDGLLLTMDVATHSKPPRIVRPIIDRSWGSIPFLNVMLQRIGAVIGVRRNVEELIEDEELILIFPEGNDAVAKPFNEWYQLKTFLPGFVELAVKYRIPIVPVAIIGCEEQVPVLLHWQWLAEQLGLRSFPVSALLPLLGPLSVLPLPTKVFIYYGKPMHLHRLLDADEPPTAEQIERLRERVREQIADMLKTGLARRNGLFHG